MNILISQRQDQNKHGDWIDSLENGYIDYFEQYGVFLVPVSNSSKNIAEFFDRFDIEGVILTGGGDVDPDLYKGVFFPGLAVSKQRDNVEHLLLEKAIELGIPVLGICRGMQFINIFFGGTLLQDLNKIDVQKKHTIPGPHPVRLLNEELIQALHGEQYTDVNSYHNLGVTSHDLAADIIPFAVFEEIGLIEGIYHAKLPVAGIQWHPERSNGNKLLNEILVRSFLDRKLFWKK